MFRFSTLDRALACASLAPLLCLVACGGDKSDPGGVRDSSSDSSATTTSSTSTTGSGGSGGGSGANCVKTVPPNANISDFASFDAGSGDWGAGTMDLSGGTFTYSGDPSDISYALEDEALHITGTVNDYAGLGMWFGPCVDASAYAGVTFTIGGTVGEMGEAVLQVQQSDNKAFEDTGGAIRGDCDPDMNTCTYNEAVYDVPETPAEVSVCFADMSGGSPNPMVDNSMLYALQFQFHCETDGMCGLDVTLDDVMFTTTCP